MIVKLLRSGPINSVCLLSSLIRLGNSDTRVACVESRDKRMRVDGVVCVHSCATSCAS